MHGQILFSDGVLPPKNSQFYHSLGGTNGSHTIDTKILTREPHNDHAYNTTVKTFLTDKIMPFIKALFNLIFTPTRGKLHIQESPSLGAKIMFLPSLLSQWMPRALDHCCLFLPPALSSPGASACFTAATWSLNAETATHDAVLLWPSWLQPGQRRPAAHHCLQF